MNTIRRNKYIGCDKIGYVICNKTKCNDAKEKEYLLHGESDDCDGFFYTGINGSETDDFHGAAIYWTENYAKDELYSLRDKENYEIRKIVASIKLITEEVEY